ncbi:MAG: four helix bundle protein [Candidatus Omnitrophica bacterium]|nr:four helix bundle protein [Candidatus Omnitrophota bacterium]
MEKIKFDFEDLEVWQKAVEFATLVTSTAEQIDSERKHFRLLEQLESASTSIALNIAEGKGRYSKKEYIEFLYIARGSLFETVTLLTIFQKNNWITEKQFDKLKQDSEEIAKMLSGLINFLKRSAYSSTTSRAPVYDLRAPTYDLKQGV